jgi:hypothetical protein
MFASMPSMVGRDAGLQTPSEPPMVTTGLPRGCRYTNPLLSGWIGLHGNLPRTLRSGTS